MASVGNQNQGGFIGDADRAGLPPRRAVMERRALWEGDRRDRDVHAIGPGDEFGHLAIDERRPGGPAIKTTNAGLCAPLTRSVVASIAARSNALGRQGIKIRSASLAAWRALAAYQ